MERDRGLPWSILLLLVVCWFTMASVTLAQGIKYEEECDGINDECQDPTTVCMAYFSGQPKRCLCGEEHYRTMSFPFTCRPLNDTRLKEIDIIERTSDLITLSWKTPDPLLDVAYGITKKYPLVHVNTNQTTITFPDLRPSGEYAFYFTTRHTAYGFYPEKESSTVKRWIYTVPSKPNNIVWEESSLVSNPMMLRLVELTSYSYVMKLRILRNNAILYSIEFRRYNMISVDLLLGEVYGYELQLFNDAKDLSEPVIGILTTSLDQACSPVVSPSVSQVTKTSATVTWKPPVDPNGELRAFVVEVLEENTCLSATILKCVDCSNDRTIRNIFGYCQTIAESGQMFVSVQIRDGHRFNHTVTGLKGSTEYTVKVYGVNQAGPRNAQGHRFKTEKEQAKDDNDDDDKKDNGKDDDDDDILIKISIGIGIVNSFLIIIILIVTTYRGRNQIA